MRMYTNLFNNLKRLYLLPEQAFHEQSADGASYFPLEALPQDGFERHSAGAMTLALNLVSQDGLTRTMVIDFDGCAHDNGATHWRALTRLYEALTQELGLSAPAVSISGRKGYGLWISLAEPIPVAQAQAFIRNLRSVYLSDVPKDEIDLRPDCAEPSNAAQAVVKLPPCLHRANKKWAAFISLEAGGQYTNTPWFESPPNLEQQVLLLEPVRSVPLSNFMQAVERLRKIGGATTASSEPTNPCSPDFTKAPGKGFMAPCVQALLDKGVPEGMNYNQANLNLANYCYSAGISRPENMTLAKQLSNHTPSSDRSKSEQERLKHFSSITPKPFYCDYPRSIEPWREAFGGKTACNNCPINASNKKSLKAQNDNNLTVEKDLVKEALMLKKEEALDLIKYAWDNKLDLSHIDAIWPDVELPYQFDFKINNTNNGKPKSRNLTLSWFSLAASLSAKDNGNAGFLNETHKYIHNHQSYDYIKRHKTHLKYLIEDEENSDKIYFIGDTPRDIALTYRQKFFEEIHARRISQEQGQSTLRHAETKEAKAKLYRDVVSSVTNPHYSISDIFANTGKSLNDIIKREEQETPFGNKAYPLFQEIFAKRQFIETPFSYLNYLLEGGFVKGRMYVLLAPPKAGKTTFAASCMDFSAASGHPVLYMGYEMGKAQMVLYGLARKTGISATKIQAVNLDEEEQAIILQAFKAYSENEGKLLTITEACSQYTLANVVAWISLNKNLHSEKTPLVVIDYLQIATSGIKEIDNHASASERVSQLSVMCKQIARKQEVALLVLSSVTKVGENDSTSKGIIDVTAARDSLAIIHAADGVLSLQTSMVSVRRKEGSNVVVETRDPWEMLESFCREQGNEYEAENILKGRQNQDKNYPQGKNSANTRAVLYLLRHRGGIGQVPLYYRKALHQFEEVPLCQAHKSYYERYDSAGLLQKAELLFNQKEEGTNVLENLKTMLSENQETEDCQNEDLKFMVENYNNPVIYHHIVSEEEAVSGIKSLVGVVALDLETTGLDPFRAQIRLLSLCDGNKALVIDCFKIGGAHKLKSELEKLRAVGHNSVFDMQFLYQANVNLLMDCTMIGHHVLTGQQRKLKELSEHYLDLTLNKEQQVSDWSQANLSAEQLEYAAVDVVRTLEVWGKVYQELQETDSIKAYEAARDAQPVIVQMQLSGIVFDSDKQKTVITKLKTKKEELKLALDEVLEGKNHSSTKQLSEWLVAQLGGKDSAKTKKWESTSNGQLKTGGEELKRHAYLLPPKARDLVENSLIPLKDIDKQLSSFGEGLASKVRASGRIHPTFNLTGTITGRMSCANPNLQQIPRCKSFRELFYSPDGKKLIIADYSQIELRVAAEIAAEHKMLQAFKEGLDVHRSTAALLLEKSYHEIPEKGEERSSAKAINFGMLYGMGAKGLQSYAENVFNVKMNEKQAKSYIEGWFKAYPGFSAWHEKIKRETKRLLMVSTPLGRKRKWRNMAEFKLTEALNTPVQGGAAEVMLKALSGLFDSLKEVDAKVVAVIHDEIIVECDAEKAQGTLEIVVKDMTNAMLTVFPNASINGLVDAKIARNWSEK